MVGFELFIDLYALSIFLVFLLNVMVLQKPSTNSPTNFPIVSVLIPARNEEFNLKKNLPLWSAQQYPHFEVLVLDDQSEDNTRGVVEQFSTHVVGFAGAPLPKGWIGKNWACQQLSKKASGQIFLFVDADVSPTKDALVKMVATMQDFSLDSMSAFLKQEFSHWSSKSVIPWALQFPILAWPPHFLNRFRNFSSLAVGNGQWFAFSKKAYQTVGGHEAVKSSVIEDMALAKLLNNKNIPYSFFIGSDFASVCMYNNWPSLCEGLTKNLAFIFGANYLGNLFFLVLYLGMIGALFIKWGLFALLILFTFVLIQKQFHQSLLNPLYYLIGLLVTPCLLIRSMWAKSLNLISWKGRRLQ